MASNLSSADLDIENYQLFFSFSSSGKALFDVLVFGSAEQSPPVKDLLPLLGALKHMSCWHAAKISVATQNTNG